MWFPDVILVSVIGNCFYREYKNWFIEHQYSTDGFFFADDLTPVVTVQSGEKRTSQLSKTLPTITMEEVSCHLRTAKGVFLSSLMSPDYWTDLFLQKRLKKFKVGWYLTKDILSLRNLRRIRSIASQCDFFAANAQDLSTLLKKDSIDEIILELSSWNTPLTYLRLSDKSTLLIQNNNAFFILFDQPKAY